MCQIWATKTFVEIKTVHIPRTHHLWSKRPKTRMIQGQRWPLDGIHPQSISDLNFVCHDGKGMQSHSLGKPVQHNQSTSRHQNESHKTMLSCLNALSSPFINKICRHSFLVVDPLNACVVTSSPPYLRLFEDLVSSIVFSSSFTAFSSHFTT